MSVHVLNSRALETLKSRIAANQSAYLAGQAHTLLDALGPSAIMESRIVAGEPPALEMRDGDPKHDRENVRRIHRWLGNLTPVAGSEPRLWTFLTHSTYAGYTALRWPVDPEGNVADLIRSRYFVAGGGLESITRNSLARLWWFGHLTHDATRADPYELTDVLLSLQDFQQAFLERALGRSRRILHACLVIWKERIERHGAPPRQGDVLKAWAKLLRLHGAVVMLDSLPDCELSELVTRKLEEALDEGLAEDPLSGP